MNCCGISTFIMKSPTKLPWLSDYYYANDNSSQDNVRDVLFHFYNISPFIERTPIAVSRQATKPFLTLRGSFIISYLPIGWWSLSSNIH